MMMVGGDCWDVNVFVKYLCLDFFKMIILKSKSKSFISKHN